MIKFIYFRSIFLALLYDVKPVIQMHGACLLGLDVHPHFKFIRVEALH